MDKIDAGRRTARTILIDCLIVLLSQFGSACCNAQSASATARTRTNKQVSGSSNFNRQQTWRSFRRAEALANGPGIA
jgi:hypothetical protein